MESGDLEHDVRCRTGIGLRMHRGHELNAWFADDQDGINFRFRQNGAPERPWYDRLVAEFLAYDLQQTVGLPSPRAGSDATSIPDYGIICKGKYQGKQVLGMRLNFLRLRPKLAVSAVLIGLVPLFLVVVLGLMILYTGLGGARAARTAATLESWRAMTAETVADEVDVEPGDEEAAADVEALGETAILEPKVHYLRSLLADRRGVRVWNAPPARGRWARQGASPRPRGAAGGG